MLILSVQVRVCNKTRVPNYRRLGPSFPDEESVEIYLSSIQGYRQT